MILPCLAISGGNSQEAVILVEELAVKVKPPGACEGTEIKKMRLCKAWLKCGTSHVPNLHVIQ